MTDKSAAVVAQDEPRVLRALGNEVTALLNGERSGGKLTAWTEITPARGGRRRIRIAADLAMAAGYLYL